MSCRSVNNLSAQQQLLGSISSDLLPDATGTRNLGSSADTFNNAFVQGMTVGGLNSSQLVATTAGHALTILGNTANAAVVNNFSGQPALVSNFSLAGTNV